MIEALQRYPMKPGDLVLTPGARLTLREEATGYGFYPGGKAQLMQRLMDRMTGRGEATGHAGVRLARVDNSPQLAVMMLRPVVAEVGDIFNDGKNRPDNRPSTNFARGILDALGHEFHESPSAQASLRDEYMSRILLQELTQDIDPEARDAVAQREALVA